MTYLRKRPRGPLALSVTLSALALCATPTLAQDSPPAPQEPVQAAAPPSGPARPVNLIRTFAPLGLLAEFNSNENFAGFTARLGTLSAHQAAANASGTTAGYRDTVDSLALPLKLTLGLDDSETLYLKLGLAPAWTDGHAGNLTEGDSNSLSGQIGLNYRPDPNLVVGLGLVAGRTELDFRHNGGTSTADYVGVQLEYMHRLSDNFGLAARAIWSDGSNDTTIPLGTSGRSVSYRQDNERLYLEASAMGGLPQALTGFLPNTINVRPIATVMYQRTDFAETQDSLGRLRPATTEELGIARLALRVEQRENRQWRLIPYAVAGVEHEFVNTVSRVDDDPGNTYLKTGLGMNVGGHGRVDLFYVRRDSFDGTYNSNQVTLFASLLL